MKHKIIIKDSFWLMISMLWFVDDGNVLPLFLAAALLHEFGHAFVLSITGGTFHSLKLAFYGAVMSCDLPEGKYRKAAVCLAGPAVSFFAASIAVQHSFYLFAGANVLLGAFNLLPIPPLDGGMVMAHLCDGAFESAQKGIALAASILLLVAGGVLFMRGNGIWLLLVGGTILLKEGKNLAKSVKKV